MVFMGYPEKIGVTFLGLLERKKVSPKKSRFTSVDSEISEFFYFCFWKRTDVNLACSPPFLFQRSPDLDHSNRNEKISLVARLLKVAHRGPDPDIYQRTTVGSEYFF